MTTIRRLAIALLGLVVIILGVAMLFLPGPGLLTIAAGLAVLGTEFDRPRRWVQSVRQMAADRAKDEQSI